MIKTKGLESLQKELDNLQKLLNALDGDLGSIKFDPFDPSSIENAIQSAYQMVDNKIGEYVHNQIALSLIENVKESLRENILQKAMEARLTGDIEE